MASRSGGGAAATRRYGGPVAKEFAAELPALGNPMRTPSGWKYLWEVGDAKAFAETGQGRFRCEIADDVAIRQKAASATLTRSAPKIRSPIMYVGNNFHRVEAAVAPRLAKLD
jgi:hypothetical protein